MDGAWSWTWAFTALLLAGVAALSTGPAVRVALFALVVGATAVRWGPFSMQATAVAGLVSVAAMALVVLGQTFRAGPVNVHRIQGAVAAYLLLGLVWALAYEVVALHANGAFSGTGLVRAREARIHLLQLRHPDHSRLRRRDARSPRGALAGRRGSAHGAALPGDPAGPTRRAGGRRRAADPEPRRRGQGPGRASGRAGQPLWRTAPVIVSSRRCIPRTSWSRRRSWRRPCWHAR